MSWLEIFVPIGLFLISFFLKLAVGKDPKIPDIVFNIIELPCDIAFISLSLLSAAIIFHEYFSVENYFLFLIVLVIIVLTLLFRAKSIKYFDGMKILPIFLFTLANYLLSITTIYYIIYYILYHPKGVN